MNRRDVARIQIAEVEGDRRALLKVFALIAEASQGATGSDEMLVDAMLKGLAILGRMRGSVDGVRDALVEDVAQVEVVQ